MARIVTTEVQQFSSNSFSRLKNVFVASKCNRLEKFAYIVKNKGKVKKTATGANVNISKHRRCSVEARQSKIEKFLSRIFVTEVVVDVSVADVVAGVVAVVAADLEENNKS